MGKSTVARALAERHDRAVHLRADEFFYAIRSGFVAPWEPASQAQNETVMAAVAAAAARFADGGYLVVVDGIIQPGFFLAPLRDALHAAGHRVAYAILQAPLEVCVERARTRERLPITDRAIVEQVAGGFDDPGPLARHVLDCDGRGVGDVVAALWDGLESRWLIGS